MINRQAPFSTIESAHEFLALLGDEIDDAMADVREELATCTARTESRRVEAWQVVLFTLTKLSTRMAESRRLVNDLRSLRNLMYRTSEVEHESAQEAPAPPSH